MYFFNNLSKNDKLFIIENIDNFIPDNFDYYIFQDFHKITDITTLKKFLKTISIILKKNNSKLILFTILPQQVDSYWYTLFLPVLNRELKKSLVSLDILGDLIYLNGLRMVNISTIYKLDSFDDSFYFNIDNLDKEIIYENDPIITLINRKEIKTLKEMLLKKGLDKRVLLLAKSKDLFGFKVGISISV